MPPPPPPLAKDRDVSMRSLALFALFALLLSTAGLSSSSDARQFEFDRLQLDRLWSGVLGCAERQDPFVTRDRFDTPDSFENIDDGTVPTGASADYSQCGRLALRSASSRILVDGIEDAIRQGGLALFNENFRLDSSIGYVWDENITGEVDAVMPLGLDSHGNGVDHALFLQPGLVFWTGLEDEERIDGNIGLVYRHRVFSDAVAGGSLFYDYDFKRKHERLGVGVDLQSGALQAGLNYYHPITDWTEGRTDYEEQALRGVDLRTGITWEHVRFDAGMGWWRFEGEDEERTKWHPSFDIEVGYRIYPGVFLHGGYERQDSGDSLGSRWNAGLAFQFSLPGLDGATVLADAGTAPGLYEPVEREKRILYEERLGIPRVHLSALDENGQPVRGARSVMEPESEDETVTVEVMAELGKPLDEDVMLNIVVAESSTAELGPTADFTYRHGVYILDPETGEQSAPTEQDAIVDCLTAMCPVMIPMGVTRFDIEASINLDMNDKERAEFIDFEIEVPDDYAQLVRAGGGARVTIGAHGNTVGFATDEVTTLRENRAGPTSNGATPDPETVEVAISVDLDSPTPITLDVETGGTAVEGTDYRISTRRLTIPANAESASIALTAIDNADPGGNKMIELTISGDLPSGWEFGDAEHTVMLRDDDRSISLSSMSDEVEEPATSDIMHNVTVSITEAPTADITVMVSAGGTGETATAGSDYTFAQQSFTFTAGDNMEDNLNQTFSIAIHPDIERELRETIILTIEDDDPSSRSAEGGGFALGDPHIITIPANDNTVGFAADAGTRLEENTNGPTSDGMPVMEGTLDIAVSVDQSAIEDITLNIQPGGNAVEGRDYRISTTSLTIPAGQSSGTITLTAIDNTDSSALRSIDLTLSGTLPNGWTLDDTMHRVSIADDETAVGFSVTMMDLAEPASALRDDMNVASVSLTQPPAAALMVEYDEVTDFTTLPPDLLPSNATRATSADISLPSMTLTFAANAQTLMQDIGQIRLLPDSTPEGDEYAVLEITEHPSLNAGGNQFSISPKYLVIRIPANDNTVAFASDAPTTLNENTAGPTSNNATPTPETQTIAVNVNVAAPSDITVGITVADSSTAVEGTDYSISTKSLMIRRGSDKGEFTVTAMDNEGSSETARTIVLMLTGDVPDGWTLGTTTHTVTILDDDAAVGFNMTMEDVAEPATTGAYGGSAAVRLTTMPAVAVTVRYGLVPEDNIGTVPGMPAGAVAATLTGTGQDIMFPTGRMFTFAAGASGDDLMQALAGTGVQVVADDTPEPNEYLALQIQNDNSFTDGDNQFSISPEYLIIRIPANDNAVRFSDIPGNTASLSEANVGTTRDVRVSVAGVLPTRTEINLTSSGSASEGSDYNISVRSPSSSSYSNGVLTIPPNEGQIDLTITVVDDTTSDFDDEQIILTLSDPNGNLPSSWTVDTSGRTGGGFSNIERLTITDNDDPAANTIAFGIDAVTTEETTGDQNGCAAFPSGARNCIAIPILINPGISGSAEGTLTLTDASGNDPGIADVYIEGDFSPDDVTTTELVFQNTDGGAGGTRKTVYIYIVDDDTPEDEKVYNLTISGVPSTHTLVNGTFTLTITDEDT